MDWEQEAAMLPDRVQPFDVVARECSQMEDELKDRAGAAGQELWVEISFRRDGAHDILYTVAAETSEAAAVHSFYSLDEVEAYVEGFTYKVVLV